MIMIEKTNLKQELLRNFNRYYFSIEIVDEEKWIHLYANVYYNDGTDSFKLDEWKFKYINPTELKEVFDEGDREKIDDVLSEWGEDIKYTQSDSFEKIFLLCREFFNGEPGEKTEVEKICELPVGNYYFDWNYPSDEIYINKESIFQNVYIGLQKASTDEILVKKEVEDLDGIESYLYVRMDENESGYYLTMKITKEFSEIMNIQEDELWKQAEVNTNNETVLMNYDEYICKVLGEEYEGETFVPMYILTTSHLKQGASAILNRNILKEFCKKFDTNQIVVIPSSINEMILFPGTIIKDERDIDYFSAMVWEINRTEIAPHKRLTDKAYVLNLDD